MRGLTAITTTVWLLGCTWYHCLGTGYLFPHTVVQLTQRKSQRCLSCTVQSPVQRRSFIFLSERF